MSKQNEIKLNESHTKNIILNALDEHYERVNKNPDPTIENIINRVSINELIFIGIKYLCLYILLTISAALFTMVISIDYAQAFTDINIVKIIYVLFIAFSLLVVCTLFAVFAMKLYDFLVLRYTKFTRVFAIGTIVSAINILKPLDSFLVDIVKSLV